MTQGVLIFAHNNRDIDYAVMSIVSGALAKKHLNVPVSLATDASTIDWMKTSKSYDRAVSIFEQIIEVETPVIDNHRRLHDGNDSKTVPFVNSNRSSVWDITPYDRTLLIDSDFLILSDRLSQYWQLDSDIMIGESMQDILESSRAGYHDSYISDVGPHLYWATTVMFTKNKYTQMFFDLVKTIRANYSYYADMYRFNPSQYRNDISFSIAKHILNGFETDKTLSLPPVLTTLDKDVLYKVDSDNRLTFLINNDLNSNYCATTIKGLDVHVMNKQSLIRNADSLLELI
jgi:hypothetical protein